MTWPKTLGIAPTELQFHDDAYARSLTLWVDGYVRDDRGLGAFIFDKTVCHPRGGGQLGDRGVLALPDSVAKVVQVASGKEIRIVDTIKADGTVLHIVADELDEALVSEELVGSVECRLELDWFFRHRQMRLHSTAHLLHCILEMTLGTSVDYPIVSQLAEEDGLNRYRTPSLIDRDGLAATVEALNRFIAEDHSISTEFDNSSGRPAHFRVWRCGQWEIPCGGTHPKSTGEIGRVTAELGQAGNVTSIVFSVD